MQRTRRLAGLEPKKLQLAPRTSLGVRMHLAIHLGVGLLQPWALGPLRVLT